IDEIDKADIEFPNDLLQGLDKMAFYCYELDRTISAKHRPVVIITSNNEKELPDAFLRRCFFHYIAFPDAETLAEIVRVHFGDIDTRLLKAALEVFYGIRELTGLKKPPSTSEALDWIKLLMADRYPAEQLERLDLRRELVPLAGALIKNEQDFRLMERLLHRN
ncbi:MAG: AAA family ATPase, partial [Bacteroidota bacterium]